MKYIHRIWLGPKAMPQRYAEYGEKWQELNPDWKLLLWTEEHLCPGQESLRNISQQITRYDVISDLIARDQGRRGEELYVQMADVFAYELIYLFGGIVVNVDIEPLRSLDYLFDYYQVRDSAYVALEDDNRIVNAVLGGPARHPLYGRVLQDMKDRYFANPLAEMVQTTGPALLTDVVRAWTDQDVTVLPTSAFNSIHWSQIPDGGNAEGLWNPGDGIIGVHHWGHRASGRSNTIETATRL